jgi:hypothetical protein
MFRENADLIAHLRVCAYFALSEEYWHYTRRDKSSAAYIEATMGSGFPRAIIASVILACSATTFAAAQKTFAAAQKTAEHLLPDAPTPVLVAASSADLETSGRAESHPVSTEPTVSRQLPSTGLSVRQKYALAYRRIVSPQLPLKAGFVSGWELATGTGPDLPTNGWGPFAERFGYNTASISTTIFFNTAFVPSLVHQDPRFFPLRHGPVKRRIWWAVRSEFVGVGDDGREMPNYANLIGFALSSIVVDAYTPRSSISLDNMAKSYSIKIAVSTGMNVARESRLFDRAKALVRHSKSVEE